MWNFQIIKNNNKTKRNEVKDLHHLPSIKKKNSSLGKMTIQISKQIESNDEK